jgi:phage terminase large subunit
LCWDELLYETGLLNEDIASKMEFLVPDKNLFIYADSAEPKSIETIRRKGFNIKPAQKGTDSVRFGIDFLRQYKMHITKRSIHLENELRKYKWAEDRTGKTLNVPIDANNHLCDSMRYVATMTLSRGKPRVFTSKPQAFR